MMKRTMTVMAVSSMAGCTGSIEPVGTRGSESTYAEAVYANYQEAAGSKIQFDVDVLEAGRLDAIAARPLVDVLDGVPAEWIVFHAEDVNIDQIVRGPRNAATDEWTTNPPALTDFETMGYPVVDAAYRLLAVNTTLDGTTSEHRALELCWSKLDHCIVVDPVVMQVDGFYRNRTTWQAEGWKPVIDSSAEPEADQMLPPNTLGATRSCKLSRYGTYSQRFYYGARYVEGYNILGWTLWRDNLGSQDISLRCYVSGTSCQIAASSFSNPSSCSTHMFGWNCACDNIDHFAYSGSTARTSAVTKCVNNFLGASINASIEGGGASFGIKWDLTQGSVYTNGATYTDTCIWQ
jgi:hypothetical protein